MYPNFQCLLPLPISFLASPSVLFFFSRPRRNPPISIPSFECLFFFPCRFLFPTFLPRPQQSFSTSAFNRSAVNYAVCHQLLSHYPAGVYSRRLGNSEDLIFVLSVTFQGLLDADVPDATRRKICRFFWRAKHFGKHPLWFGNVGQQ